MEIKVDGDGKIEGNAVILSHEESVVQCEDEAPTYNLAYFHHIGKTGLADSAPIRKEVRLSKNGMSFRDPGLEEGKKP